MIPNIVNEAAKKAVEKMGLDFGAVTVLYSKKKRQATVLKIDTTPTLRASTMLKYVRWFKDEMGVEDKNVDPMDLYDLNEVAEKFGIRIGK
jgi:hypothetical protein